MRSWQRMWDNEHSGRYNLIPSVDSKVLFPLSRDIGISYCRILLHDSMLKDDSFRSGTFDSSTSECGSGKETTEHYLLHCSNYRKQREEILDQLLQLCDKDDEVLEISETLLLAPQFDNISKRCSFLSSYLVPVEHYKCSSPSFTMMLSDHWFAQAFSKTVLFSVDQL